MELDVHLSRRGDEPWGFRLIGGSDYGMPLTVVKVLPNSPASDAGLQNGDTVLRIENEDSSGFTHEDAKAIMKKAANELVVGVVRGLYDPVLDDYEPIYEPIDQEDFDQPSHPTEVPFDIQNFPDDPNYSLKLPEFHDLNPSISRSLTASPFMLSSKPYRPFSTEPIPPNDVPPLEDPIILNPSHHDDFSKHEDSLEAFLPPTRFKLPISEHYDPDGTKKNKKTQIVKDETAVDVKEINIEGFRSVCLDKRETFVNEVKKEIENQQIKELHIDEVSRNSNIVKNEVKFEETKQDINFQSVESTAATIVEDSIDKALTVAQEIKNEIDVELRSSVEKMLNDLDSQKMKATETSISESKTVTITNTVDVSESKKSSAITIAKECIDLIDKTTEDIVKQKERKHSVDVLKQVEMFEKVAQSENISEKQIPTKKAETVKMTSESNKRESIIIDDRQELESKSISVTNTKSESTDQRKSASSTETKDTKSKMTTARLLAEQRAYTIGLKTIPQIRGSVHSSYHYNLLLKTFFIHLTDVMVALSRFILEEPVLNEDVKQDVKESSEQVTKDSVKTSTYSTVSRQDVAATKTESLQHRDIVAESAEVIKDRVSKESISAKTKQDERLDEEVGELIERRKLSGSKMAQLTERKSAELTDRMDAVISEFQTKTEEVISERSEKTQEKTDLKSIETESKVSQEVSEKITSELTSISASETKSTSIQSKQEIKEAKRKEREGKPTYVAIVESHVYTNEDTILEDHQFSGLTSGTTSVQSPNESHTAVEITEAFDTAKSIETLQLNQEVKLKEQSTQAQQLSIVESETKAQRVEIREKETQVAQDMSITNDISTNKTLEVSTQQKEMSKAIEVMEMCTVQSNAVKDSLESLQQVATAKEVSLEEVTKQEMCAPVPEVREINKSIEKTEVAEANVSNEVSSVEMKSQNLEVQEQRIAEVATKTKAVEMIEETQKESKSEEVTYEVANKREQISTSQKEEIKMIERKSEDESAALKIVKEQVKEVSQDIEIKEQTETLIKNKIDMEATMFEAKVTSVEQRIFDDIQTAQESSFTAKSVETSQESSFTAKSVETAQESSFTAKSVETAQESSFTAKSVETAQESKTETRYDSSQLTLDLKKDYPLQKTTSQSSVPSEISTPTPSRVPPTPLTDEYMFKLDIPLPTSPGGTPYPCIHDLSPIEEPVIEDPHFVKKKLIPHIDLTIESKIFDPPLPSPEGKVSSPVYTKPGLRGGANKRYYRKEEIREIERKSSLLTSAIDETIRNIEQYRQQIATEDQSNTESTQETNSNSSMIFNGFSKLVDAKVFANGVTEKSPVVTNDDKEAMAKASEVNEVTDDEIKGYRPVGFNPDERVHLDRAVAPDTTVVPQEHHPYKTEEGEVIGSHQGIVDGLEAPIVDQEAAKDLGKPGMTEDKIAALISGESEMLREAHVMGLSRVLKSHMSRPDDSSVDFKKIKPIIDSLKDSEVLRALNDELIKTKEEKKKEERKWTTFLQKPSRPVPRAKFGYPGWTAEEQENQEPYKVKIVKQPKPKVAPDYKPEDFETGPLPWEERAQNEPPPPPVEPEDPILIPEETPEFLEAVDPLPESEVPDLEDTGIPLPPPPEDNPEVLPSEILEEDTEEPQELDIEAVIEETEKIVEEMEQNNIAEQIVNNVQNMVDPNAPLDQQLKQMQAQIAALAQLPCVIQQTLELVTKQLTQMTTKESSQRVETQVETENAENTAVEVCEQARETIEKQPQETAQENPEENNQQTQEPIAAVENNEAETTQGVVQLCLNEDEMAKLKMEEQEVLGEQQRIEKQKKEIMDQMKIELNGRQLKQRPTPRVGKPAPMFGPLTPQERPVVLPGGRKWRKPQDAYNEQFIAETLSAQAELIQGKTKGFPYESDRLPYDERINFLKYEKPPVSLDHLQHSDVYKLIHDMEKTPMRGTDMRTPVICEADYREDVPLNSQYPRDEKEVIASYITHLRNADP